MTWPDGKKCVGEFRNGQTRRPRDHDMAGWKEVCGRIQRRPAEWSGSCDVYKRRHVWGRIFKMARRTVEENRRRGQMEKCTWERFRNGAPNGLGTSTSSNRTKCVGEFKDGRPNGQGTATYTNGDVYVGELQNGKAARFGNLHIAEWKQVRWGMERR